MRTPDPCGRTDNTTDYMEEPVKQYIPGGLIAVSRSSKGRPSSRLFDQDRPASAAAMAAHSQDSYLTEPHSCTTSRNFVRPYTRQISPQSPRKHSYTDGQTSVSSQELRKQYGLPSPPRQWMDGKDLPQTFLDPGNLNFRPTLRRSSDEPEIFGSDRSLSHKRHLQRPQMQASNVSGDSNRIKRRQSPLSSANKQSCSTCESASFESTRRSSPKTKSLRTPSPLESSEGCLRTEQTFVQTKQLPAVTHEHIKPTIHHLNTEYITREIHNHYTIDRTLPVKDTGTPALRHFAADENQHKTLKETPAPFSFNPQSHTQNPVTSQNQEERILISETTTTTPGGTRRTESFWQYPPVVSCARLKENDVASKSEDVSSTIFAATPGISRMDWAEESSAAANEHNSDIDLIDIAAGGKV